MTVIAVDPAVTGPVPGVAECAPSTPQNLTGLLQRSDAVVVACPLTPQTHHLIGREALATMKETAYLVSVSRGGIIDEIALAEALEKANKYAIANEMDEAKFVV